MGTTHGSIGRRANLKVRSDHSLTPQTLVVKLSSGAILDPTGGEVVLKLYANEHDTTPLLDPAFDPPALLAPDALGRPRYLLTQSRALLADVLAALPAPTPRDRDVRVLWWTCSFLDAAGQKFPLYFGEFRIAMGAVDDG